LRRELGLRPIGRTVYFMPPYTLSDDEFALLVARTGEVLDAC
jgi:adenosylmethionine---8-amino-7-oxononanoate aminotransferase